MSLFPKALPSLFSKLLFAELVVLADMVLCRGGRGMGMVNMLE